MSEVNGQRSAICRRARCVRAVGASAVLASAVYLTFVAGCQNNGSTATSRPASTYDRQEAAMKDPFGYSPNNDRSDISGGGLTDFDRDGMKKDLKNVFDP